MRKVVIFLLGVLPSAAYAESVDYATQIKPLLAARCYSCHGALNQKSDLRLDTVAAMKKGGEGGPALLPKKGDASQLVERISSKDIKTRMPPEGEGSSWTPTEIALLKAWIDQGATGPEHETPETDPRLHWAFRRPERGPLPSAKGHPIDALLDVALKEKGLTPQPPADRRLLLRRVYLDLIGLPPTADEIEKFLGDTSPHAFEEVVDRLLSSPAYGERWGRHWMDIWRYSDWWGLGDELRSSQKNLWHWRDWIIESLNDDVGYDEMVRQMLAADELYPNDLNKLRATGYLARQYFKYNRNSWLDETVEHTSKALMGMTLHCARCHDHKYDPIAQRDFYRFRAFFEPYQLRTDQIAGETNYEKNGIPRAFDCNLTAPTFLFLRGDEKQPKSDEPLAPGLPPILATGDLKIEPVALPVEAHRPELRPWVLKNYTQEAEKKLATAKEKLERARNVLAKLQPAPEVKEAQVKEAKVQERTPTHFLARDDFTKEKPELWTVVNGEWIWTDGKLEQRTEGDVRSVLQAKVDMPADFQARLKFITTGGRQWKSVGLSFDFHDDHDILVYLSAVAEHSRLQVAHKQNGAYIYPAEGLQNRSVKIGELQDLVVQVRDRLINVEVNGELALVYRLPVERRQGAVALVTFDGRATFTGFELAPLPADTKLQELALAPTAAQLTQSPERAMAGVAVAEAELAAASASLEMQNSKIEAERARWEGSVAERMAELARAAAKAEKHSNLAQASLNLAELEFQRLAAAPPKQAELDKKIVAARQAIEKAKQGMAQAGEKYTPLQLSGAKKTPESNLESAESQAKPFPATSTGRRTALARWLTDGRHPTVARVAANHIWMRHMGAPLVPTVFEFGRKGLPPTHPALLDYLALELQDHGWSMKHLHRLIVTSAAYRRSSSARDAEANLKMDPDNRYYWRANGVRLEAQAVRDSLLHLAGELEMARGGPSIPIAQTDSSKRRSIYFVHSHNENARWLSMFDDANVQDCYRRDQSIVPQQALTLANSGLSLRLAEKIAGRIVCQDDLEWIHRAYVLVLASEANADEIAACQQAMAEWRSQGLAASRVRTNLVWALINHNDFIMVR